MMKEVTEHMTNCDTTKRGGYERDDEQYSFEKCKCSIWSRRYCCARF